MHLAQLAGPLVGADEVHNLGIQEVQRIRSEMDSVIIAANFEGTFSDFLKFLRTNLLLI